MGSDDELESLINELVRLAAAKHYTPTTFLRMRTRWGTKEAIKRLVISGDIQSGFTRLATLGLVDYSIEAAVMKFPGYFDKDVRAAAQWRLDQVKIGRAHDA